MRRIWPLGVTGTPVIDKARATLYLDAMVMRDDHPRHEIYALSLADGSVEPGWPVDVATALGGSFDPMAQNQRGALALFGGRVFVPYSGLAGDCGDYHGRVVGFSTARAGQGRELLDPGARRRHLGARRRHRRRKVAVRRDRQHHRASRNGATAKRCCASVPTSPARSTSATISPPRTGRSSTLTTSTSAAPRRSRSTSRARKGVRKLIFAIGKDGVAYLLDRDNLGGIGGELASAHVTPARAIASPAVWSAGDGVFVALEVDGRELSARQRRGRDFWS